MEDGLKQRIYENILRFLENYRYIKSTAEATNLYDKTVASKAPEVLSNRTSSLTELLLLDSVNLQESFHLPYHCPSICALLTL